MDNKDNTSPKVEKLKSCADISTPNNIEQMHYMHSPSKKYSAQQPKKTN